MQHLLHDDPQMAELVRREEKRIESTLDLIASENHMPAAIFEVMGSIFNTKTIEGYPGRRFHAGCEVVDEVENLAIERAKKLFGAEHVNVQPHSGTSANLAVYKSVLAIGDPVLALSLPHGGHLSHGHKASLTSQCYNFQHYHVDMETGEIDYAELHRMALERKPAMIVTGASAYARVIDYARIAETARQVGAYFLVDLAHFAGLVAAGVNPSPVPYADFVTITCYKTLQGPRGGAILCRDEFAKKIDNAVFPGCQGTSAVSSIAAKAVSFKLAGEEPFVRNMRQTVANARTMAHDFQAKGYAVVGGGTDTHQVILDVSSMGMDGASVENILESVGIIANKNHIPKDSAVSAKTVSGLRIGTSGITVRGFQEPEIQTLCDIMHSVMQAPKDEGILAAARNYVHDICAKFPIYEK